MKQSPHHKDSTSLYSFKGTEQKTSAPNLGSIIVSACSPSLNSDEYTPENRNKHLLYGDKATFI